MEEASLRITVNRLVDAIGNLTYALAELQATVKILEEEYERLEKTVDSLKDRIGDMS